MINLEWYRTFKTIYDNGTLTGAAEELFMTQPGVSQQLNALENYMGKKLFERSPRKMIPTEYAKILYLQVEESVTRLDDVENAFRIHALQVNPTVCIGAPHSFFFNHFTKKIHQIKCSVRVKFGSSSELLEELEAGNLHLLISTKKAEHRDIVYEELLTETMLLVASPSIDRSRFGYLVYQNNMEEAERWLSDQTWYTHSNSMGLINKFWQRNFRKKPGIMPKYVIPDLNIITQALQFGQGISLIPDYICKEALHQDKLKAVWKGNNPTQNVLYIATNKNNPYPKELEEIKQLLKDFRRFQ